MPAWLIPAAAAVGSAVANWFSTENTNEDNRNFAREQQDKQNAYNTSMWERQNEYNSPEKSMKRLVDAGLNPNMIVGGSVSGNVAGPVPQSAPATAVAQPKRLDFDMGALQAYNNVKLGEAQHNNLEAQNTVLKNEALLKEAQVNNTNADTARKVGMTPYEMQSLKANIKSTNEENDRRNAMQSPELIKKDAEIQNLYQQTQTGKQNLQNLIQQYKSTGKQMEGQEIENDIKRYERNLRAEGLNEKDPTWQRLLIQQYNKHFKKAKTIQLGGNQHIF